jgi:hypothetical protein
MSRRVLVLGLTAFALGVPTGSVPIESSDASVAAVQHQIARVLDQRERAVLTGDADAWLGTLDDPANSAQRAQFEALDGLELQEWSERLIALEHGPNGSWRAGVQVRYRFPGDETDAIVSAVMDLTSRFLVAGWSAAGMSPWEIDGVRPHAGRHSLVLGAGSRQVLGTYAAELDQASASVGALLGESPPQLVLVLPDDWNLAGRMVPSGVGPGLAAVTSELGPPDTKAGPLRIVADPAVLAALDPASRTALFGHEAFHVAQHGAGAVPLWLAEGLADYAGYRESGIAVERSVAGLLRHARKYGVPTALPPDAAFGDPQQASWAYEGAHLAVRLLVEEHGVADVIALHDATADRGVAATEAALRDVLGTDIAAVTAAWRAEVAGLASR